MPVCPMDTVEMAYGKPARKAVLGDGWEYVFRIHKLWGWMGGTADTILAHKLAYMWGATQKPCSMTLGCHFPSLLVVQLRRSYSLISRLMRVE